MLKMMYLILGIILSSFTRQTKTEECTTPNNEKAECISLYACPIIINALASKQQTSIEFVRQSNCGGTASDPMVCCGSSANFTTEDIKKPIDKIDLLPSRRFCGYQHSDDYFSTADDTLPAITEFPWLAAIVSESKGKSLPRCGGSLINNRYVLSAAHCFSQWAPKLEAVHLGEYDVNNETDCIKEPQFEEECSQPLEIFGVEKIIPHPMFNLNKGNANDIALLRLNRTVMYSDYIRPICLPLPGTNFAKVGDVLTSSGWGLKPGADGLKQVNIKKKVFSKLIETEECRKLYKDTHIANLGDIINENVVCSIPVNSSVASNCQGDSGGPLSFSHRNQWHQEDVLSFGKSCEDEFPRVYVKVANYIDWIMENIEP